MSRNDQIRTFTDLYHHTIDDNALLSVFLRGHLAIEFLLRKLIIQYDNKLESLVHQLNHAKLIQLCYDLGIVSELQKNVLVSINAIRNKMAHKITFQPDMLELKTLWGAAAKAFVDLTDGISQGIESLDSASSLDEIEVWEYSELFVQICYDLHAEYVDRGGDLEDF